MATQPPVVPDPDKDDTTAPLDDPATDAEQKPEDSPEQLKAQLREEKRAREAADRLVAEMKQRDEFWEKRLKAAEKAARPAPQRTEIPEPDPVEELDLLTLLTEEKDPAKIRKTLAKAVDAKVKGELQRGGFVSKAEMENYISQLVAGATQMSTLVSEFPELGNPKSEFFAETQRQLASLSDNPAYTGTPDSVLQRMAAQAAKLKLIEAGKTVETADERDERIANQRGGRRGRGSMTEDASLTPADKDMARKLGVSEADFLAQKKALLRPGALGPAMTADRMMREW